MKNNLIIRGGADFSGFRKELTRAQGNLKGFQTQTGVMSKACAGMGAMLKTAFAVVGVAAMVKFGKESIQASTDIENAMIGLKSIIEGQGRSFQDANKFIKGYISDGLIPATEAVTAYKNLAMRGYTDTQITTTLQALKDSASFGRQASLSLGQAVSSATEGLKNENSILVDNSGVTKNVSMMWKDYAKSIGVGVQQLTKQQKIQAEVTGIMEETRFQTGDAAKVANTYSGSILRLQFNLNNMKIAFGNFLKPIVSAVIPIINSAITAFTKFFNIIAQVSTLLFGKQVFASEQAKKQENALGGAAQNQNDLAKATDKANKASKNQLSSFDEINVLAKETANAGGADVDTPVSDVAGGTIGSMGGEIGADVTVSPNIQTAVDTINAILQPLKDINLDNLKKAFDNFKIALEPFTSAIFAGLKWAWDNLLVPLAKWTIQDLLPKWLGYLAVVVDVLNGALSAFKPVGIWLWDNFLKPMASFVGDNITDYFKDLGLWISDNKGSCEAFAIIVGSFGVSLAIVNTATAIWNVVCATAAGVTTAFGAAMTFLTSPIGIVVVAIAAVIAIVVLLVKHWDKVKEVGIKCWEGIKAIWNTAATWIDTSVVQPIAGFFTGLWDGIAYGAKMVWWGIEVGALSMVNFVTTVINNMIEGILAPFNLLIDGLNLIPGVKIPNIGFSIPQIALPPIPKLAQGAVIPPNKEFMAVLGDQKHGTNIETPLDTMVQAFKMANAESGGGGETVIRFTGALSELVRILKPEIDKENSRRGTKLIIGAV